MGKIYTIDEIAAAVKPIAEKYGIEKVWLFGSYARGEATEKSDVDLLISYQKLKGMFALGGVYSDIEDAFNEQFQLITEHSGKSADIFFKNWLIANSAKSEGILIFEAV